MTAVRRVLALACYTMAGTIGLIGILPPWQPGVLLAGVTLAGFAYGLWSGDGAAAALGALFFILGFVVVTNRNSNIILGAAAVGLGFFAALLALFIGIMFFIWVVGVIGDRYYDTKYKALQREWTGSLEDFARTSRDLSRFERKYYLRRVRRRR